MSTELTLRAHLQAAIACFPEDLHAGWELAVANHIQAALDKLALSDPIPLWRCVWGDGTLHGYCEGDVTEHVDVPCPIRIFGYWSELVAA